MHKSFSLLLGLWLIGCGAVDDAPASDESSIQGGHADSDDSFGKVPIHDCSGPDAGTRADGDAGQYHSPEAEVSAMLLDRDDAKI